MLLDSRMHRMIVKSILRLLKRRLGVEQPRTLVRSSGGMPGNVQQPSPLWRLLDRACLNLRSMLAKPRVKFIGVESKGEW